MYCVSFSCLIVDRNYVIRLSTYIPYGPSMMYNLKPVAGFSFESLGLYVIDGPHGSCCENTLHFVLCNEGWKSGFSGKATKICVIFLMVLTFI